MSNETRPDGSISPRRKYGIRTLFLVGILSVVSVPYVLNAFMQSRLGRGGDAPPTTAEIAAYEAKVLPTKDNILNYLDGKTIRRTGHGQASGQEAESLTLEKEAIEQLTIERDIYFFTSAKFDFKRNQQTYAVEILINHNPIDGTFVFNTYMVQKAYLFFGTRITTTDGSLANSRGPRPWGNSIEQRGVRPGLTRWTRGARR